MKVEAMRLDELSSPEVDGLDRGRTIFAMALSPLEVHGPHLPLGTDVMVAEEVLDRTLARVRELKPEIQWVVFPPYYMGSDTIPRSVEVNSRAVNLLLKGCASWLADRGFHFLLVTDNHGGPRHQIAIAKAVRSLYRERGFHIIAPFLSFYRRMIEDDPELLRRLGVGPGACGDVDDDHAGLNETSLMLRLDPSRVRPTWKELPRVVINRRRWPGLILGSVAKALEACGGRDAAQDLRHVGLMLSWVTDREPSTYIGEPRAASADAGERMLDAHAEEAASAVLAALEGRPPYHTPLGWTLRFMEPSR
jgi:creatinine amidohydrolase/Fe(II)-dependent formamide hydrolase-like protein